MDAVGETRAAVRDFARTFLLATGAAAPIVVGCSGGGDSLALVAAAAAVLPALLGREVVAGIVDHQLQPGSAEVAARAAAVAESLGVLKATVLRVNVAGPGGPEAAARAARYTALLDFAAGAPVLVAHTADDQAESVLLGLARGSGARSIAGMSPWRPPIGRPFLDIRRAVTGAACRELGLDPYLDPHNQDPSYRRVRVRHEVLPLLEEVLGGGAAEALTRTAAQAREDNEVLDALAEELLAAAALGKAPSRLDAKILGAAPRALRTRAVRLWLAGGGAGASTSAHLGAIDNLLVTWRGQGPVAVPGRLQVRRERDGTLWLCPSTPTSTEPT